MAFAVHHEHDAEVCIVRPEGELDLSVARQLADAIDLAIDDACPTIVVVLSEVTFMDSTGLRTLVEGQTRTRAAGRAFMLAHPSPRVQPILTLARIDDAFDYFDRPDGLR